MQSNTEKFTDSMASAFGPPSMTQVVIVFVVVTVLLVLAWHAHRIH